MKKFTVCGAAVALCCLAGNVQAQEPEYPVSASTEVFDFTPWQEDQVLFLFAKAIDEGRKYPTKEEFEAAGFNLDLEFSRSHVRPAQILEDSAKNVVPTVYPRRRLWMNTPSGQGQDVGGYPSSEFHSDVFSMWNYTTLFGSWNHPFFQAPGSWADAAHKNGTHIFSGMKFWDYSTSDASEYMTLIKTKNENGEYKYVDAFLNALLFLGMDGINYNFEVRGYDDPEVVKFHQACYKRAKEIGFDSFHIGLYTTNASLGSANVNALFGTQTNGRTSELMLNYASNNITPAASQSVQAAEQWMGTSDGLYAGVWMSTMDRSWSRLEKDDYAHKIGICLWGEHKISRFFQFVVGDDPMDMQANYQKLLEKGFSGGYRSPIVRPGIREYDNEFQNSDPNKQLQYFHGMAEYIPERTAIQGDLPFNTYFSLGNGDFYAYKGKKTLGSWYNMGQQDYVPTYRWLIYQTGTTIRSTDIDAEFTHEDAYVGGSALRLKGQVTSTGSDVVLYRAKLTVSGNNATARLAVKSGVEGNNASNLSLILKKFDNDTWLEFPVGDLKGAAWEEKEIALSGISQNDVIEYIGLRVKGNFAENYKMLVGQLQLCDDRSAVKPASIDASSVVTEVKEEKTTSMSVKLTWNVDAAGFTPQFKDYGLVYNDEVNIDHFEILYKNGENGRVSEVGRTSTWSAYVGNIQFEGSGDDPYIGVRSVSVDLKSYSPVVWVHVPRSSGVPEPAVEDKYGKTYLNLESEGVETAQKYRYVSSLVTTGATENLNYTSNAPVGGDNYLRVTDQKLKVEQGQKVQVTFAGKTSGSDDGLKWCIGKAYIDWNLNYIFEPGTDELIMEVGTQNQGTEAIATGYTFTLNVPSDAAVGLSRLRMVFSDAWFAHPGPTGGTAKGFSIDFDVEVTGSNPGREPEKTYADYRDQGVADEPDGLDVSGIEDVVNGNGNGVSSVSSLYPTVATDVIYFNNVDKAWIYTVDGQLVKYVNNNPESVNISDLSSAMYVVKMQKGNVVRSQKMFKK